ncbi:MAG: hypothetical protein EHM36_10785 [Deltaproteobacteria bacterium]|nr:MAG: hypothetical protein EHM36_10785 [Deltaproteobacteria bacterium]
MSTSTHEVKLSGNIRGHVSAFHTSDGGSQTARIPDPDGVSWRNFTTNDTDTVPVTSTSTLIGQDYLRQDKFNISRMRTAATNLYVATSANYKVAPSVNVYATADIKKPRGLGLSARGEDYDIAYFMTNSRGRDQEGGVLAASVDIVEKIALVVPPLQ